MAVVYVLMYFKCKICFTVYTGETKINDTCNEYFAQSYTNDLNVQLIHQSGDDVVWFKIINALEQVSCSRGALNFANTFSFNYFYNYQLI